MGCGPAARASGRSSICRRYVGLGKREYGSRRVSLAQTGKRGAPLAQNESLHLSYQRYVEKFHSVFRLPSSVPVHYVPGNHDFGLGRNDFFSPYARQRYSEAFSPPNAIIPIANHSFIMLDSVGLVEEDYMRYASEMQFGEWEGVDGGVIEFIKDLGEGTLLLERP